MLHALLKATGMLGDRGNYPGWFGATLITRGTEPWIPHMEVRKA